MDEVATVLSVFANGKIFGERIGVGPPRVLALHGWRKDHRDVAAVVAPFDAIAIDLPGFGASPMPTKVWGAADFAVGIAALLDEFAEPPVVFGHSFGGRVALNLAAAFPERVGPLVLTGVPLLRPKTATKSASFTYRAAKIAHRIGVISDERIERERQKRGSADYRAARGIQRDIFVKVVNESYEVAMRKTQSHVELVWGANDTEAPLWHAEAAANLLTDANLTIVPGGTHWSLLDSPDELHQAIQRVLS